MALTHSIPFHSFTLLHHLFAARTVIQWSLHLRHYFFPFLPRPIRVRFLRHRISSSHPIPHLTSPLLYSACSFAHDDGLPGSICDSVWNCMMVNLYYGIPVAGGLVQFLPAYDSATDDKRGWWLAYQILFFFFVGPIVFSTPIIKTAHYPNC